MLKLVYAEHYDQHVDEIERCALFRAWPEQVLLALVLKMLTDKLTKLLSLRLMATALAGEVDLLTADLHRLRDAIAAGVNGDRTVFTIQAIAAWSRMISLFRTGRMPADPDAYEVISPTSIGQLAQEMNVQAAGFGELGIALAVLEHGRQRGLWALGRPAGPALTAGAIESVATWPGAAPRPIFFARSAEIVLSLEQQGAFSENTIVIHSDAAWHQMLQMLQAGTDSVRVRSRAPGRTGKVGTRHVSIASMVETEADVTKFRARFLSEVTL